VGLEAGQAVRIWRGTFVYTSSATTSGRPDSRVASQLKLGENQNLGCCYQLMVTFSINGWTLDDLSPVDNKPDIA